MKLYHERFQRIVRQKARGHTVYRRDPENSSNYGGKPTYSELNSERDILIGGLDEEQQPTGAGERQSQLLIAYTTDTTDLQVNDRIDHGGYRFEVLSKVGRPDENEPAVYRYELDNL